MASMEKVSADLKLIELKKDSVRKTLENLHSQSSSLLLLTIQWKDLEDHFDSIQKAIKEHSEEVGLKEKHFDSIQKSIEGSSKEVESKEKHLELVRKSMEELSGKLESKKKHFHSKKKHFKSFRKQIEQRAEEVGLEEKRLDSVRKQIKERSEELESKENQLELVQKTIQESVQELELKEKKFALFQRSLEERSHEVELKEKQLDSVQKSVGECCKELEEEEKKFEAFRRLAEERSELNEKRLDSLQKSIEERSEEVESKEKRLDSLQKSIEERLKEVKLKEEQLGSIQIWNEKHCEEHKMKEKQIDAMQKSVEKRSEELELKEKQFNSIQLSIKELSEELGLKEKQLDTIQKLIEEGHKEVEMKEKQLNSIQKLIEESSEEFTSKERQLDSVRKSITEGVKTLELQENQFDSIQLSIEERSRELELRERKLHLIRKTMKECLRELQLKEKQFDSIQKSIEDRLEELKSKEKQLESIQKLFEERSKDLESKKKQLDSIQNSIEEGSNIIQSQVPVHNAMDCSLPADLRFTMDGKSLQLFLNKRLNEHELIRNEVSTALRMSSDPAKLVLDAMQGFYPPHLKEGDIEFEASVIRRSCILLLEQLMNISPQINPHVKEEAMKLAGEWKAKMRVETENSLEVLGFLQLLATYGLASTFDSDDLLHLLGTVAQHRQAPEIRRTLGFADKNPVSHILHPQVKIERPDTPANNPIDSSSMNVWFCDTVDERSMQLFLNDQMNEHNEVFAALRMSLDPAKLVLDAMQEFCPPHSKKGGMDFEMYAIRSCILLEHLMRISPEIEPHLKEEAMKLAVKWKAKMRVETENSLVVFVFLQLLATYGLVSAFNGDEVLKLLEIVAQHRRTPDLCRALGFSDKIPDLIKLLVEKQQWLEAIRYSYAFELVDKFPPQLLLEAQLKFCKEGAKKIYNNGNSLSVALDEAADKEIATLRAVIKCIADYNLESIYSPEDLEKRVAHLEKHKAERRRTEALPQQQRGNKRPWTVVSSESATPSPGVPSIQLPSQLPAGLFMNRGAKYSRTSAGQRGPITPDISSLRVATPPPINPHTSSIAWQRQYGLSIAANRGAGQFGTHFSVAANLGAGQYGLSGTSGGNGLPPQYSFPGNTSKSQYYLIE